MWAHRYVGLYRCGDIDMYVYTDVGTYICRSIQMSGHRYVGLYRCGNIEGQLYTDVGTSRCSSIQMWEH